MPELIALRYSPWSEKARWALDHHRIDYTETEYLPMLGTPVLRWRLGRWRGPVTVPALVDDGVALGDSTDIALHADAIGQGPSLFRVGREREMQRWDRLAERAMSAGRLRAIERVLADPVAVQESVPSTLKALPGPLRDSAVRTVAQHLRRKYPVDTRDFETTMRDALRQLRDALGPGRYVLGRFSYADIVMAQILQFVRPHDPARLGLGPASVRAWTASLLEDEFADLLAWRDALYRDHRSASGSDAPA
ncbi:MAG: glutathione S-transferase [Alphaproteobacteria bacterium]|nr:glutathione S-transferase [Alphaproteobacteria bacterium]